VSATWTVIVTGGRSYNDMRAVDAALDPLLAQHGKGGIVIVTGGASGADFLAYMWACEHGVRCEKHPADWRRWGKSAGPRRNQAMLDAGADVVMAFPGGAGTADMVRRAKSAGVPVVEVAE